MIARKADSLRSPLLLFGSFMLTRGLTALLLLMSLVPRAAHALPFYVRQQQYRFGEDDPRCSEKRLCSSEIHRGEGGHDYSLNFIEFGDDGGAFEDEQLAAALEQVRAARANAGRTVVFIYIHGWHNNAEERSQKQSADCAENLYVGDVAKFRNCGLKVLADNSAPTSSGAAPRVVGIYLAWHGTDFGWPPFYYVPSYPFRRHFARTVGLTGMAEALRSIFAVIQEQRESYFVVAMGHSFGARVLEAADEVSNLKYPQAGIVKEVRRGVRPPLDGAPLPRLPVDIVFYVNAATSHYISIETNEDWKKSCAKQDAPAGCGQNPLYLAVSSRADILTAIVMPIANLVFFAPLTDRYHIISAANTPWMQTHQIPRLIKTIPPDLPANAFCFVVPVSQTQTEYFEVDPKNGRTPAMFWAMNTDHWIASLEGMLHSIPLLRRLVVDHWVISSHGDVWNTGVFNMVRAVIETEQTKAIGGKITCGQRTAGQMPVLRR